MDKIKIVRLQSGEDIIAKYFEMENGEIVLYDPMNIIFKRLDSGKSYMMMSPWLPIEVIEDNKAIIFAGDIVTLMQPKKSISTYYRRIVNETLVEALESSKQIEESLLSTDNESYYDDTEEEDIEQYLHQSDTKKQLLH